MSTYKLHIDGANAREKPDPIEEFSIVVSKFKLHLREQRDSLREKGLLNRGRYSKRTLVEVGDAIEVVSRPGFESYGLVMTSPPYGDNGTTIPYGQFSYLPLRWIDLKDVGVEESGSVAANTHATDSASLGGTFRGYKEKRNKLTERYRSAGRFVRELGDRENGIKRFVSFFHDLDRSVELIAKSTIHGGVHAWTVSNRRICGIEVPMIELLGEMLESRGVESIGKITRGIRFKKMALKNSLSETMSSETILLARKRGDRL